MTWEIVLIIKTGHCKEAFHLCSIQMKNILEKEQHSAYLALLQIFLSSMMELTPVSLLCKGFLIYPKYTSLPYASDQSSIHYYWNSFIIELSSTLSIIIQIPFSQMFLTFTWAKQINFTVHALSQLLLSSCIFKSFMNKYFYLLLSHYAAVLMTERSSILKWLVYQQRTEK